MLNLAHGLHASGGGVIGMLVDGMLQLLEELVESHEIVLGLELSEWRSVVIRRESSDRLRCLVAGTRTQVVSEQASTAGCNQTRIVPGLEARDWHGSIHEPAKARSEVLILCGINLASFGIAEEVVEVFEATLARFSASGCGVTSGLGYIVVDWSIACVRDGRTKVVVIGGGGRVSVASSLHMAVGILVVA